MMRRTAGLVVVSLLISGVIPVTAAPVPGAIDVLGQVTNAARPLENVLVIAFNLAGYHSRQTFTSADGSFRLPSLPGGIYRLIAVKQGFAPAVATITPKQSGHPVVMKLRAQSALSQAEKQEIWQIRQSLPSDILREVEVFYGEASFAPPAPKFSGQMASLAGMTESSSPSFAQTTVGVQGSLGGSWTVNVRGRMQKFADEDGAELSDPSMESSGVDLEVRSSARHAYRLASSRNLIRPATESLSPEGGVEWHRFEWQTPESRLQVRYLTHENYEALGSSARQMFELTGDTLLYRGDRSDLALSVFFGQDLPHSGIAGTLEDLRTADIGTTGRVSVHPALVLRYGMQSRFRHTGNSWSPSTGAELKLGKQSALILSASQKVINGMERSPGAAPLLVNLSDAARLDPRYRYSLSLVSDGGSRGRFEITARQLAIDEAARIVVTDAEGPFWDAFDLVGGEVQQDLSLSYSRALTKGLVINVATTTGRSLDADEAGDMLYLLGALQTFYSPSGTSLDVTYRHLDTSRVAEPGTDVERLYLRMGQSVPLPLDLRLLVGMDLARGGSELPEGVQERRLVGGVSVAF